MATGLDAQQKIFASNPEDRRAFEALEEHFFLEGEWQELVDLYRARLRAPSIESDPDQRAPVLFRLGQILEERVLDHDAAIEVYWQLAQIDPTNRPALRQLRGIHERRESWDMVLQIAELESATAMPPYERAAFESELGRTWQDQLGDPTEAERCFERALESDPQFPAALEGLAHIHLEAGRSRDAATILEQLTSRLRGPERAPVWIDLGRLYAGELEEPARARQCFAAALDDDPFQSPAVEWSLLLATAEEDWPAVSELLENRFDIASGARHRAAIAVEASQIQLTHLGSTPGARAWIDRALELADGEPSVLLAASAVERADGDQEANLRYLDRLIETCGAATPFPALIEAAELHADFGQTDQALGIAQHAAEKCTDGDARILRLQARLLRDRGEKSGLAEILETLTAQGGVEDEAERLSQLQELARLQEEDLGDDVAAKATWQRAFELAPGEGEALDALERLARKHEDDAGLRGIFEQALAAAGEDTPPALTARFGLLLLERFDESEAARTHFEAALAADADCLPARAGIRQIAERSGDPDLLLEVCEREATDCSDPEQMADLARTVAPILEARGQHREALDWVTRWCELSTGDREALERRADLEARVDLPDAELDSRRALARLQSGLAQSTTLERQAVLQERLGDLEAAGETYERALEARPEEASLLRAICRVTRELDRPQDLTRWLRSLADALPTFEQADPLEELAATLEDPLGDIDTAIVVRWRLTELPDGPADAATKLENLLVNAARYSELAHLYFTQRQLLDDDDPDAFELDRRRATVLLDDLGHCDEAAEIFRSMREQRPEDASLLDLLERALRAGDDAAALCALLEERADGVTGEARALVQLERATLLEELLGEPHAACDLYEEILRDHPDVSVAETASRRLEALLESTGQWERLRERLEIRAGSLPPTEQATVRERIADICRNRLQDVAGCADQLEQVAALTTDRVHVWQQLAEIYDRDLDRPGDWLRVVEAELESGPAPQREFLLRVGAARLCLDDDRRPAGHDRSEAFAHYERVIAVDPGHAEAAEALAAHYEATSREADAARILESRLEACAREDEREANDVRLRLAALYAGALDDAERARGLLERARARLGTAPEVALPLADLYERGEHWDALATLALAALDDDPEPSDELGWRLALGRSERAQGRLEEAASAYRAALVLSPDDREIEDALVDLYERLDEIEPLVTLLEKRLAYAAEDEAIDLRLRLARLHADSRSEPAEALGHLEHILDELPQHRDALDRALELAQRIQDPARLVALLDRALDTPLGDDERARFLERRGDLLARELGQPEQAIASYRESIRYDAGRTSARHALREQLVRLERWPAVLDCLFVEASEATPERRIELFEQAAELAAEHISVDASLPWLSRLREARPDDPGLLSRVADVHRRAGRFEAALRALEEQIERTADDAARCALQIDRALLLERELHAPGRAVHAYHQALERALGARRDEILVELDRLTDLLGRPHDRAEILEARLETASGEAAAELRRSLAALYCVELARPASALAHLEAHLETVKDGGQAEMDALVALDAALRASGRLDAWVPIAERELELIDEDLSLAANTPSEFKRYLREELARAYDESIGDAERALAHLRALRDECPADERARSYAPGRLQERLRDLLRRTGRRRELALALEDHVDTEYATSDDRLELARLREEVVLDLPGARDTYQTLQDDPGHGLTALRGVRRTSERLRDWEAVAAALEVEVHHEPPLSRSERTAIARRIGEVCWQRLGAGERAAEGYRLALELDSRDLEALDALIQVLEARGDADEIVPLLRQRLELLDADDTHRRRETWLRLATLCSDDDERASEAIDAYHEAASIERLSAVDELRLARIHQCVGGDEAFCETFGRWCDREDSGAIVDDHLEHARALHALGDLAAARTRALRATALAPESVDAWTLSGELAREDGEAANAAESFARAAEHESPECAAALRVLAADCVATDDPERAHGLLTLALNDDAGSLDVHVALARVCDALSHEEQTARHAEIALDLARAGDLDEAIRLELALLGGRAAHARSDRDTTRRLFGIALEIDERHVEALERVAEADFEAGDHRAAREPLERRLEQGGEHPDRARHLAMIARGLEDDDLLDAAWSRYEEAIEAQPDLEVAHEGLVRVHERTGRTDAALEALERWVDASSDDDARAAAAFRAAEHALALEDESRAQGHLETATRADPALTAAWLLRCELVAQQGSDSDTRRLCDAALESVEADALAAPIALRAARLAEIAGDMEGARRHYAQAAAWDPRAVEAALCESRLARMAGDWREADDVLERFLAAHPDPESPTLAHLHLERGRLLSGPLEDVGGAVAAYENALARQPDLGVARTALARLLLLDGSRWREALDLHRGILSGSPTASESLRALASLAAGRQQNEIAEGAAAVLEALGLSSPWDPSGPSAGLRFAIHPGPPMAESDAEHLRRLAHQAHEELGALLAEEAPAPPSHSDPAIDQAIRRITEIEDELTAPGLMRLTSEARGALLTTLAGLFLEPGGNAGDSRYRTRLEEHVGRWTRRRLRRIAEETDLASIEAVDHTAWTDELRAMAAAQAIDRGGEPLGPILRALLVLDESSPDQPAFDGAEIGTLAAGSESTRRLLTRITTLLCERLEQNR